MTQTCSFPDCGLPVRTPGVDLCNGHWTQQRRGTELRPLRDRRPRSDTQCAAEGCPTPRHGKYCAKHEFRILRHGDPDAYIPHNARNLRTGLRPETWIDTLTYSGVHARVRAVYGRAADRTCECGSPARDWAYVGPRDPGEKAPHGSPDQYQPMCRPCHARFDREKATA